MALNTDLVLAGRDGITQPTDSGRFLTTQRGVLTLPSGIPPSVPLQPVVSTSRWDKMLLVQLLDYWRLQHRYWEHWSTGDSNTIRIGTQQSGTQGQGRTFIAGIANSAVVAGSPVFVSSTGQLGVGTSPERYRTEITTMGSSTGKLQLLRPVTIPFKNEPQATLQYGLIAEEVDKVCPELVIRDQAGANPRCSL